MTAIRDLTELFVRGEVYADSWPDDVRRELNVADPLVDLVVAALDAGNHVILTGNAGDGKTHLAAEALFRARPKPRILVERDVAVRVDTRHLVFIRDAATLPDGVIIAWTLEAIAVGAQLVLTLNEGPLTSLAARAETDFYRNLRDVNHARARGASAPDPDGTLLINLAGRQLIDGDFVSHALSKLLPAVASCSTCDDDECPKVIGRDLLAESADAQARLTQLLRLLSQSGRRLTARDLWIFLVELFFGAPCPPGAEAIDRIQNWWFSRVFADVTSLGRHIRAEFDPIYASDGMADAALWIGHSHEAGLPKFGIPTPQRVDVRDTPAALDCFASMKRAWFFLSPDVQVDRLISAQSRVPEYAALVDEAKTDRLRAIRECIGLINQYRLQENERRRLKLSRHHVLTAATRPHLLAASEEATSDHLNVRVPYLHEDHGIAGAGFKPTQVELVWQEDDRTSLLIDYRTWLLLHERRTVYANRDQEALDAGLDLFIGRAPIQPESDPEITAFDHETGQRYIVTIRSGNQSQIEVSS